MRDEYVKKIKDTLADEIKSAEGVDYPNVKYYKLGLQKALGIIAQYEAEDQKFNEETSKYLDKLLKTQVREKSEGSFFGCMGK